MVQRNAKAAAKSVKRSVEAEPPPADTQAEVRADDREDLSLADLARRVAARTIRPRVGEVRRLAEAVLSAEEKRARKKTGDKKPGKKRKLAKIPGRKAKG